MKNGSLTLCEIWGYHSSVCEDYCRLGCDALYYGRNAPAIHRNVLPLKYWWISTILHLVKFQMVVIFTVLLLSLGNQNRSESPKLICNIFHHPVSASPHYYFFKLRSMNWIMEILSDNHPTFLFPANPCVFITVVPVYINFSCTYLTTQFVLWMLAYLAD